MNNPLRPRAAQKATMKIRGYKCNENKYMYIFRPEYILPSGATQKKSVFAPLWWGEGLPGRDQRGCSERAPNREARRGLKCQNRSGLRWHTHTDTHTPSKKSTALPHPPLPPLHYPEQRLLPTLYVGRKTPKNSSLRRID